MINWLRQYWRSRGLLARLLLPIIVLVVVALIGRSFYLIEDEKAEGVARYEEQIQEIQNVVGPSLAKIAARGDFPTIAWVLTQQVNTRSTVDQLTWRFKKEVLTAKNANAVKLNSPAWFAGFLDLEANEFTVPVVADGVGSDDT